MLAIGRTSNQSSTRSSDSHRIDRPGLATAPEVLSPQGVTKPDKAISRGVLEATVK
jgi:hypothetical protein